jgi:hypothetical protein
LTAFSNQARFPEFIESVVHSSLTKLALNLQKLNQALSVHLAGFQCCCLDIMRWMIVED